MPDPLLTTIVQIGSITTAALGLTTTLVTRTLPWLRTKITSRAVTRRLGTILTEGQVERAVRYYVEPMCQDVDPAGAEEPRLIFGVRQRLFKVLDEALMHPTEFRYIFLLADSGMGKSSAAINYYARHLRRFGQDFDIEVVPLGIPNADERISVISEKTKKVLFLDAFDEDTLAIVDHAERLRNLLNITQEFRRVLITCRTQFFGKDEEIPTRTGHLKIGARAPGEAAEYYFHKIYLSPFGDAEIRRYIRKRYPAWRQDLRSKAKRMVAQIPNLTVRPMLLTHIDDLIRQHREMSSTVELYEEMVEAWLVREEGFIRSRDDLRRFSESLAVDLYVNRQSRGAERVTQAEIEKLAHDWGISIESWALTGRSLLNRDADGNYKFAHRSIMEYMFLKAVARGDARGVGLPWTDQMTEFFLECLTKGIPWASEIIENAHLANRSNQLMESLLPEPVSNKQILNFVAILLARVPFKVAALATGDKALIKFKEVRTEPELIPLPSSPALTPGFTIDPIFDLLFRIIREKDGTFVSRHGINRSFELRGNEVNLYLVGDNELGQAQVELIRNLDVLNRLWQTRDNVEETLPE